MTLKSTQSLWTQWKPSKSYLSSNYQKDSHLWHLAWTLLPSSSEVELVMKIVMAVSYLTRRITLWQGPVISLMTNRLQIHPLWGLAITNSHLVLSQRPSSSTPLSKTNGRKFTVFRMTVIVIVINDFISEEIYLFCLNKLNQIFKKINLLFLMFLIQDSIISNHKFALFFFIHN